MLLVRPHRAPVIEKCAQAAHPPAVHFDTSGDAASLGTAAHEWLASHVRSGVSNGEPSIADVAKRHAVDADELGRICFGVWSWWEENRQHFPNAETEVGMDWRDDRYDIVLAGTCDLLSAVDQQMQIRLIDWKSGWLDGDASAQAKCYGWLALQNADAESVYACIPRPRLNVVDAWTWTRQELAEWWDGFARSIAEAKAYTPGDRHCRHCPRLYECPAVATMIRASRQWLLDVHEVAATVAGLPDAELFALRDRAKLMASATEMVDGLVRAQVAARGVVASGDGWEMFLKSVAPQEIKATPASWPILQEACGDRLPEVIDIGKGRLEKVVKDAAPKRQKGKAWEAFMARLESVGAVEVHFQERLEVRRVNTSPTDAALVVGDGAVAAGATAAEDAG